MKKQTSEDHDKAVALCASRWGISPGEVRRQMESGEVSVDDFNATVELAVLESPSTGMAYLLAAIAGREPIIPLLGWLYSDDPEAQKQERWNQIWEAMVMAPIPASSPEQKAEIDKLQKAVIAERKTRFKHGKRKQRS